MTCIFDPQTPLPRDSFVLIQTCDNPNQNRSIRYVAYVGLSVLNFHFDSYTSSLPGFLGNRELNSYRDPFDEVVESTNILDQGPLKLYFTAC